MAKEKLKTKRIKEPKYRSEEQKEIIRFIIILVSIVVLVAIIYGISKILIKDESSAGDTVVTGEINYNIVSVGTMFNRSETEYYVAIYNEEDTQALKYAGAFSAYRADEEALKIYFCDLSNGLNSKYYVGENGESNPNAKTIEDLAFGDFTFIKIRNGRINKYFETLEDVKKELGVN